MSAAKRPRQIGASRPRCLFGERAARALAVSGFAVEETAMMAPGAIVSSNPSIPKTTWLTSASKPTPRMTKELRLPSSDGVLATAAPPPRQPRSVFR